MLDLKMAFPETLCQCSHRFDSHDETRCLYCSCLKFRPQSFSGLVGGDSMPIKIKELGTYEKIASEIGALVEEKQKAYGNAVQATSDILKILYPNGIQTEQYRDAFLMVRIIDKLMRIANNKDAFRESPFSDLAGYGILGVAFDKKGEV